MKRTLTHTVVQSLKPQPPKQLDVWDSRRPGFGVRVSPKGTKTFIMMYQQDDRKHRFTLGRFPDMSVADAREQFDVERGKVAGGENPAKERARAKSDPTFGEFADTYLERHAAVNKRPRSVADDRKMLNSADLEPWKNRKLAAIERRDVIAVLDEVVKRNAPIQANRLRALLSRLFNFAIARDLVQVNPVTRTPREPEQARERKLNDDELKELWLTLDTMQRRAKMPSKSKGHLDRKKLADQRIAIAFKLAMLTGARRSEILGMRWDELDLAGGWWNLPGTRTKNGQDHRVPLVPSAKALIEELPQHNEFVFPGGKGGIPLMNIKKPLEQVRKAAELEDFRFHDLRRTVATRLAELGVERTALKKILNHSERDDITAVYDRHSYDAEKRVALTKWERRLMQIVSGATTSKVVKLPV